MDANKSYWDQEEFEDLIISGIVGFYEKRNKIYQCQHPAYKIKEKDIKEIKSFGFYFLPNDRVTLIDEITLPFLSKGCFTSKPNEETWIGESDRINGYLNHVYFRRSQERLKPELLHPGRSGIIYEIFRSSIHSRQGLIIGKNYVMIGEDGKLYPIYCRRANDFPNPKQAHEDANESCKLLSAAHGFYDDRKYLWNVRAEEKEAHMTFGVYPEQIKSLFYARQNPLSSTGRRRPILHWVASHRRRLKEGIEIDIEKHLRGVTEFEMEGTKFSITLPTKIVSTQNKNNEIEAIRHKIYQTENDRLRSITEYIM